ncbi:helicase associated domain-containing protein [Streptomyces flavidovirens]|uniref:helicase associated domain-containing protein n=1 Tax=Streptomyces flavidovirens TaxID=67298 RepID=UPI0033A629D9
MSGGGLGDAQQVAGDARTPANQPPSERCSDPCGALLSEIQVCAPATRALAGGVEVAVIYAREHGDVRVPFTYRVPAGEDAQKAGWPASLANFPLGQWTADARRFYARGYMDEDRVLSSWRSSA